MNQKEVQERLNKLLEDIQEVKAILRKDLQAMQEIKGIVDNRGLGWLILERWGSAVRLEEGRHLVQAPLHADGSFNPEESCDVCAPPCQEFLDAVNQLYGTSFKMENFSGR